ncbi:AbrB/MazE/SpoVT family DNA-binding domain-containing protein [Propionivibrio sp.]|uniref:AbrB/MazE/SpoVT family DNA-binding domain-containing protein n=1 Tax=Propionivibrio sp. TaxID=2212460 RepID=UPI003BF3F1EB
MRITSKGQVTIPLAIRNAAGLLPNTDVEFVYEKGEVLLRPAKRESRAIFEAALKNARAVPLTKAFQGKSADEIMEFLRGE